MAEIVYRQMPAPRDIPQKIPAPRAKIRMQKPQSGGEFSVQIPGGARGGMVMAKIDNCITNDQILIQVFAFAANRKKIRFWAIDMNKLLILISYTKFELNSWRNNH